MVVSNDGVAFPMTHLQALVNQRWALAKGPAVGNLSPAVLTTDVALSLSLLATQVLPHVCINMQVQRFTTPPGIAAQLASDWAAAGFKDTLLRCQMKREVANGDEKKIQP